MKTILQLVTTLLLISMNSEDLFSQNEEYTVVKISRISYINNHSGVVKRQLEIHLENNRVYYRKNVHRKFREIKTTQNISLFSDRVKMNRIKQISKSITQHSEECLYHNEYGYYRIEFLKFCRQDLIYGEIFLINTPYDCKEDNDQTIVREYCDLITSLFNKK